MSFEQTKNFADFQEYKKVKASLAFQYKGIELNKVIAWNLIGITLDKSTVNWKDFIALPFLQVDAQKFAVAFQEKDAVFSTLYSGRKDHAELGEKICSSVENACMLNVTPHKKAVRLNLVFFVKMIKHVFANPHLSKYSFLNRAYLFCYFLYAGNQVNNFERAFKKLPLQNKKYIPFVSAVGIEALLTLFFKKKGAKTFHIFHGLFGRYQIKIANDVINGENITADEILAFGESTRLDMIKDFNCLPQQVFVAGNPKYPDKAIHIKTTFKKCLVLNGFGFYDQSFALLLPVLDEVAAISGIAFDIKPHPNSSILNTAEAKNSRRINFLSKEKTVKELLVSGQYDFAITFNTVTYYECMYYGLLSLRYAKEENLDFEGLNDRFTDKESLLDRIDYFQKFDTGSLNNEVSVLLKRTLGMGINNYDTFINH